MLHPSAVLADWSELKFLMTKLEEQARRAVVDEYGRLVTELAPFKSKQARLDELAKIIRGWYVDADASSAFLVAGDQYEATLSAKGMQTVIDVAAAIKALGRKKLTEAATFTLKALEAHLPAATIMTLSRKEQTGSRSLVVQPASLSAETSKKAA